MYNTNMIRTQIYIPEDLHQTASIVAKRKQVPLAKVLRDFILKGVIEEKKKLKTKDLTSLADLALTGGPKNLSSQIDKYLYEK